MTLGHMLSQMGAAPKQLIDRYSEYPAQSHEQHVYYPYEPATSSHIHVSSPKHHYKGDSHKSNAAMSALTLLAFLFFLHILQQCIRDHMAAMNTPQVMIMTSSREGEENVGKTSKNKIDKSGINEDLNSDSVSSTENKYDSAESLGSDKHLMKLSISEYKPKTGVDRYKEILDIYNNQSPKTDSTEEFSKYKEN